MSEFDSLLTKEDVCRILGVKESWLNSEIQAGNMPHLRLGKKKFVRFRASHIEEYLAGKEQPVNHHDREITNERDVLQGD